MRNIFYLLFISLLFISCESFFPPGFHYVSNAGINLDKIFKKNYTSVGCYVDENDTISSIYKLDDKRRLTIIRMNNVENVKTFTAVSNDGISTGGSYMKISSSDFEIWAKYALFDRTDAISSVRFSSDGQVKYNPRNNYIKEVYTTCNTFSIEFNGENSLEIKGESRESDLPMDCLFYEKDGKLYICILDSNEAPIVEHSVYNCLF